MEVIEQAQVQKTAAARVPQPAETLSCSQSLAYLLWRVSMALRNYALFGSPRVSTVLPKKY